MLAALLPRIAARTQAAVGLHIVVVPLKERDIDLTQRARQDKARDHRVLGALGHTKRARGQELGDLGASQGGEVACAGAWPMQREVWALGEGRL